MASLPQFGGTNGVIELNAGQPGSLLHGADLARYTVNVIEGADAAAVVPQGLIQQNVTFEDNLGFRGAMVVWDGMLKVASDAVRQAIYSQLNQYRHGSPLVGGTLWAPNPTQMKPTRLVNAFDSILSERAKLEDWSSGRVMALSGSSPYTLMVPLRIIFKKL
jgi:hypothetical protein